ncbi:hypothetical protein IQ22_01934 [Pseudomonas duriflava]|uniref:Alpha/beta hydrolase n=1 Tax=Pseudomonas duriflava TaxID=459528 RepID=A0A562QEA2_9PSED|nr:alpha/beta hydrolase [Pseudomonas duriflava]TWI55023.1 hypothetical protein IQ22_01934 [Pseudomonas duriflava]
MHDSSMSYLIVPGWQGSPDNHWQSHWQRSLPQADRVEQADWLAPVRQEWISTLERYIGSSTTPVLLIAHSLGCVTVTHWASQASPRLLNRVAGALLVAPADVERPSCPAALTNFAPLPQTPLPFPAFMVGSDNDHAAQVDRIHWLARQWQAELAILPGAGHINVKSGHERWEEGFTFLYQLQERIEQTSRYRA